MKNHLELCLGRFYAMDLEINATDAQINLCICGINQFIFGLE